MTITTQQQIVLAFGDALARGETEPTSVPRGYGYDILCGSTIAKPHRFTSFAAFPIWDGWHFPGGVSHAAGRYQFEPVTWKEQMAKLHLSDFGPAAQDEAAWDLACAVYHHRTGRSLPIDLAAQRFGQVASMLQSTWTSLSPATFEKRYRAALLVHPVTP